jgi:hypothetical protein
MMVKTVVGLLCDDICETEGNPELFPDRDTLILCSYLNRKALPQELTLEQAGIRSGDRLALV